MRDYLKVVRRRKWIILLVATVVPLTTLTLSLRQPKLYQSSSEVLLGDRNLATVLTNTIDYSVQQQPDRVAATQADVASTPEVAQRVITATRTTDRTAGDILAECSAAARQNADILDFSCTDRDPGLAQKFASAYATQFTEYRRQLDTTALERARTEVEQSITELEKRGEQRSSLYATLVGKDQQLRTMEALQTSNAFVIRPGGGAVKVQPTPLKSGAVGLALGLILGLAAAFLWETFDTRVRSAEEIGRHLSLPLLARIPEPPRRLQANGELVMLADPSGVQAESFRMLRTNLEFARLEHDAKTIMITSAVEREGKSTTIANLAVALARAGQRVVLVDLDLRRPFLDRFFGLHDQPGMTQVALGHATLDEALATIPLTSIEPRGTRSKKLFGPNGNGTGEMTADSPGSLQVLVSGPIPPDAGEFVQTKVVKDILSKLRDRADIVLIDSPPLLRVGDAMTLSDRVDAIIVATRIKVVRRPVLNELRRILNSSPATRLGFILTGAESEEGYGYGYGYNYYYSTGYYYGPREDDPREQQEQPKSSASA
jgi:Mrp family chromosome partitioning ATPase/capsular polysaccharide biosynthesis protein